MWKRCTLLFSLAVLLLERGLPVAHAAEVTRVEAIEPASADEALGWRQQEALPPSPTFMTTTTGAERSVTLVHRVAQVKKANFADTALQTVTNNFREAKLKERSHFQSDEDYTLYVAAMNDLVHEDWESLRNRASSSRSTLGVCYLFSSTPCTCSTTRVGVELVCAVSFPDPFNTYLGRFGVDIDLVLCPELKLNVDAIVSGASYTVGSGTKFTWTIPYMGLGTALIPYWPSWWGSWNAASVDLYVELTGSITALSLTAGVESCYSVLGYSGCFFQFAFLEQNVYQIPNTFCDPSPSPPAPPGLCDGSCLWNSDGVCDDGGPGSEFGYCAFGTDCTDCGIRFFASPSPPPPLSPGICSNTCTGDTPWYASDGDCDDGGVGSEYSGCGYGSDCADCGVRSFSSPSPPPPSPRAPAQTWCSNGCGLQANDGICSDGGPNARESTCPLGDDCADCGFRYARPKQQHALASSCPLTIAYAYTQPDRIVAGPCFVPTTAISLTTEYAMTEAQAQSIPTAIWALTVSIVAPGMLRLRVP